jgi:hypothetical protein
MWPVHPQPRREVVLRPLAYQWAKISTMSITSKVLLVDVSPRSSLLGNKERSLWSSTG